MIAAIVVAACSSPTSPDPERPETTPPPAVNASAQATAIAELTNVERSRNGLAALTVNARLMQAAQIHADQCARAGRIAHDLPEAQYPNPPDRLAAAGYIWQAYGENLAMGQTTPAAAMEAWMNSPGHRENIVNATFTEIGTGFARDGSGRPYYVQVFGRPR